MPFTCIQHRFDSERHAFEQFDTGSGFTVMENLGVFMKHPAYTMAAIFTYYRAAFCLGKGLDGLAYVAKASAGPYAFYTAPQRIMGYSSQPFSLYRGFADKENAAGIPMKAVFDNSYVDIDHVAIAQCLIAWDAMADYMIDGRADRFWETPVIQGRGDRLLGIHDIVMANPIQFIGGDASLDMWPDHIEYIGR